MSQYCYWNSITLGDSSRVFCDEDNKTVVTVSIVMDICLECLSCGIGIDGFVYYLNSSFGGKSRVLCDENTATGTDIWDALTD